MNLVLEAQVNSKVLLDFKFYLSTHSTLVVLVTASPVHFSVHLVVSDPTYKDQDHANRQFIKKLSKTRRKEEVPYSG